ncbi:unnamed protein product [Ostreobium quekettii]|uniref:Serpin domain-containing protein n=1 Tax=Ostreobium quekettii TaxID=121088 RepID=A0A8S1JCB5_9CHLO|nr:unnamed protein product [Ostreobium quekettii]
MASLSLPTACLALTLLTHWAAAQSAGAPPPKFVPRTSGPSPLARANADFAFRMYCRHLDSHASSNFAISPASVTQSLAQLYAGAAGATAEQMRNVMKLKGEPTDLDMHRELAGLAAPGDGEGYNFSLASRVYLNEGFEPLEGYSSLIGDVYGAEAEVLDFGASPEASRRAINEWVEGRTGGRIADLVPEGSLGPDTRMVLANALYFRASWATQFDPAETQKAQFRAGGDGNSTVDMMKLESMFAHAAVTERDLQVLELPYSGGRFSMFVVLPDAADGLPAVEASFCDGNGNGGSVVFGLNERLTPRVVVVNLPRFSVEGSVELHDLLPEIGMRDAFNASAADLSGIDGRGELYVTAAQHKAFVEVNEEGTEAAAGTAMQVAMRSLPPTFEADRPFMFYIMDNANKALVMLGRMWDPEVKA